MDKPEDNRVHIHRDGIFGQRLLGAKGRRLNALNDAEREATPLSRSPTTPANKQAVGRQPSRVRLEKFRPVEVGA